MPYIFQFYDNNELHFEDNLVCQQCEAISKNGQRCRKTVCIGTPFCWIHLLYQNKLKIKESNIPNSGKGLFVFDKKNDGIVFKKGDTITKYYSEQVTRQILNDRYNTKTAPYGVQVNLSRDIYFDGALSRGVGSVINHNAKRKNCRFSVHNNVLSIKATKNLKHNEELFINYGRKYNFNQNTNHITKYSNRFI